MEQTQNNTYPTPAPSFADSELAWRVMGASVQGVSHARLGVPCQDAQGYRLLDNGLLLIAAADGAGSALFSDVGARRAVDAALDTLYSAAGLDSGAPQTAEEWKSRLVEAFSAARDAVNQQAEEAEQPTREYACTLTCAVTSAGWLVAGQIGDGAVVADFGTSAPELLLLTPLQRGEYANETHFITEEDALEQAVIEAVERPARALAVMSDGLIRLALKMPAQTPHAPFFDPLFRFAGAPKEPEAAASQLAEFLNSERVNDRTDDDKTLVLAVRIDEKESDKDGTTLERGSG